MPADNWTRVSMRDCIENCPRFGEDGSITDFTQDLLEQWRLFVGLVDILFSTNLK